MTNLSAKKHYLASQPEPDRLAASTSVNSTPVKTLMVFALSQMADEGHSTIAIAGAKHFRHLILNFADPQVETPEIPVTALERVPTPDGR